MLVKTVFLAAVLATSFSARAEYIEWTVKSDYPYASQIEFFSENFSRAWPGSDQAYELNDYGIHTYRLNCEPGESICYGAWDTNRPEVYWGVRNHDTNCANCCAKCGAGPAMVRLTE